jgi:hypothetical protein
LGLEYPMRDVQPPSIAVAQSLVDQLNDAGLKAAIGS